MNNHFKSALALLAAVLCVGILGGCLSPIAIQAVGGVAGGAAPSTSEYRGGGKGESYFIARYEDVVQAVLMTGEVLSLETKEQTVDQDRASLEYYGGRANRINLLIERHTDTMTSILFDVGWTGSIAFGRLVARQINFELDKADAFLEDWTPERFD